jgi:hypothetical protein
MSPMQEETEKGNGPKANREAQTVYTKTLSRINIFVQ